MRETDVEMIADYRCQTGENPLWHSMEKRLYWIDIPAGRLFRFDPASGLHEMCHEGGVIGGFTVQADGSLLLFMDRGAVCVWRNGTMRTVIEEIEDERDSRFNNVIADPRGRVFCGTMSTKTRPGRLYRLDTDGTLTKLLDGVGTSNGMGFTPDRRQLYHTDTRKHQVYLFDYDEATGAIANRKVFATAPEGDGRPDGLTVDAEGFVWSARWDGGCVVRYTPDGIEKDRIVFPARKVSCITFGGENYTDLYATTAGGDRRDEGEEGPLAGALFRVRPGVRGVPEFQSRIVT